MPHLTPLHDMHRRLGAVLTEFNGWSMPLRYGSETVEHRAVRSAVGLFDLCHMGQIEVTGPDASAALDYAVVSRVSTLVPGRAKYTMICDERGGVLDDLIVYRLADDRFLVVANAGNARTVCLELQRRVTRFRTTIEAATGRALLAVQGPNALSVLNTLSDDDFEAERYYSITESKVAGLPVLVARTGYTGEDGFELMCRATDACSLWDALSDAGKAWDLMPAGLACRDTLRLEAGMPLYGHELSREVSPYDAGLGRVVHLDKPDFFGRPALHALSERPPAQQLVGLLAHGRRVPRAGYPVLDADGDRVIGHVTSGAPSPSLGKPIAMALVQHGHAEPTRPGEQPSVAIDIRGTAEPAAVVPLPFYRRPRKEAAA